MCRSPWPRIDLETIRSLGVEPPPLFDNFRVKFQRYGLAVVSEPLQKIPAGRAPNCHPFASLRNQRRYFLDYLHER